MKTGEREVIYSLSLIESGVLQPPLNLQAPSHTFHIISHLAAPAFQSVLNFSHGACQFITQSRGLLQAFAGVAMRHSAHPFGGKWCLGSNPLKNCGHSRAEGFRGL